MTSLADLPWTAAAGRATDGWAVLVPVGATEQHGPHLPVTTDTDLAVAVAERAAARSGKAVVAPPLAFGSSGEHEDFAGTLSIGAPATEAVLVELGRSACRHFAGLVLVSTHGGNRRPLTRASARLASEGRACRVWTPRWGGDPHAGRTETSLMLAVAPERVHLEAAEAGDDRPLGVLLPLLVGRGVRAVSANGVLGDPAGASPDEGRRLLEAAADDLAAEIVQLAAARPGPSAPEEVR